MLPFHCILCPTDYSEASRLALQFACEMAEHFNASICVLHVLESLGDAPIYEFGLIDVGIPPLYAEERLATEESNLEKFVAENVPARVSVRSELRVGDAAKEIDRATRETGADLVVIATHGATGWQHFVFGSVTEKVLHQAVCPVLVIHPLQRQPAALPLEEIGLPALV